MKKFIKAILLIILVLIVVGAIIIGLIHWLISGVDHCEGPNCGRQEPTTQPEWCPNVEVIAIPGTWESRADDDPVNPMANPNSFMLTVTRPLQQEFAGNNKVKFFTVPYTAQFKNVQDMNQMTYDDSRTEGTNVTAKEIRATRKDCPLTDFVLMGFSQGAVIAGDLANQIGTNDGTAPVPDRHVRGVALVADGRREPGVGVHVGNPVGGVGAEVSLEMLNGPVKLIMPGASMRGPRPGGFGTLTDKVIDICAPNDHICDAPTGVENAVQRARALFENNAIHAQYATNPNVFPNMTTTQWLIGWTRDRINEQPVERPKQVDNPRL